MNILGINAYHGDASAALVVDGQLVAAVEEERFTRVKHAAGFPKNAIAECLAVSGATTGEIEHVAISRDPRANLLRKALFVLPGLVPAQRLDRDGREIDLAHGAGRLRLFQLQGDSL